MNVGIKKLNINRWLYVSKLAIVLLKYTLTNRQFKMDLTQTKLSKTEWTNLEILVSPDEKRVLKMIVDGYNNVNIRRNDNLSLGSIIKIECSPEMETYLYFKYFDDTVSKMIKTFSPAFSKTAAWTRIEEYVASINGEKTRQPKKVDMMRIVNMESIIDTHSKVIVEFVQLDFCVKILESISKRMASETSAANVEYAFYVYTLVQMKKSTIAWLNKYIAAFVDFVILFAKDSNPRLPEDVFLNSIHIIEKNAHILKHEDRTLYEHQKQLFQIFSRGNRETPKLVLYTAPTGTGKTLSPLGLSTEYRIIFICAARHVGLALAKSAISVERKVAFAFGCNTASDIRLHYFSISAYTTEKKKGKVFKKVDNSVGDKVEIMICDIASYITAMHYMLSFNDEKNIILYWDEPTISLDYNEHPLHEIIHRNWSQNKISKVVLSCATLPCETELFEMVSDFRVKFDGAETHTITSYDCKKSISILNARSMCVLPHLMYSDYADIAECINQCETNRSLLRYLDLGEIVRFAKFVCESGFVNEAYNIGRYFATMDDITMFSIKQYYVELLKRVSRENWDKIHAYLASSQTPKFCALGETGGADEYFRKSRSMPDTNYANANASKQGEKITRTTSVQFPVSDASPHPPAAASAATTGILITTKDAHTLTDGPTIFLADDIDKIGRFYIQQSKIPTKVFSSIMAKIDANADVSQKIEVLVKTLEDKMGAEAEKEKKAEKDNYNPEIKGIMNAIKALQADIQVTTLDSVFVPNTVQHQKIWVNGGKIVDNAFIPCIEEEVVREIMAIEVSSTMKILLLLGIGMFSKDVPQKYTEIMKKLAYDQKLFLIIASSDYIYGTNYQFAHSFIGKDLSNMTQQKIIQAMGRVGRNNIQQEYTVRFRDDALLQKLFAPMAENVEAVNMCRLFSSDPM
jgi:hypothetical protein